MFLKGKFLEKQVTLCNLYHRKDCKVDHHRIIIILMTIISICIPFFTHSSYPHIPPQAKWHTVRVCFDW
jgi:hypothetical protein